MALEQQITAVIQMVIQGVVLLPLILLQKVGLVASQVELILVIIIIIMEERAALVVLEVAVEVLAREVVMVVLALVKVVLQELLQNLLMYYMRLEVPEERVMYMWDLLTQKVIKVELMEPMGQQ